MERLEYWNNFINKNLTQDILVDDEVLRLSIINDGKGEISEFFTFMNTYEMLEFLKEVIIVSVTISAFNADKNVSIHLREHKDILDIMDVHMDYFNKKIGEAYLNCYEKINIYMRKESLCEAEIRELIAYIEGQFDAYNQVYLTLDYAKSIAEYIENMIAEYENGVGTDVLDRDLKDFELSKEKLIYIYQNVFDFENGIRENILNKLKLI